MDKMLFTEEKIKSLKRNNSEKNKRRSIEQINENINLIQELYMNSQIEIFKAYFDILYNRIQTLLDLTYYKAKLEEYKRLIGIGSDNEKNYMLKYYEAYCENKYNELKLKEIQIKKKNNLALTVINNNKIMKLFNKIREITARVLNRE